jgi:hypothetical protein
MYLFTYLIRLNAFTFQKCRFIDDVIHLKGMLHSKTMRTSINRTIKQQLSRFFSDFVFWSFDLTIESEFNALLEIL